MKVNIGGDSNDAYYRWTRPCIEVEVRRRKTVLTNLEAVCEALRHNPKQVLKFIRKRLNTGAHGCVLRGTFSVECIEGVINEYVKRRVLCPGCALPELYYDKGETRRCAACGYRGKARNI